MLFLENLSFFDPDTTINMFYIHFFPNLKTPAVTFVNERTIWYCLQMLMLLSKKALFTECYFVTFINSHCLHVCMSYV